jgi:hypothetical protein
MEALMASAILFAGVLAVTSAITSGQKKAFEAEQQVAATLAAEEVLGAIVIDDYDLLNVHWAGIKPAGDFTAWIFIPPPIDEDVSELGVVVSGKMVTIEIHLAMFDPRVIIELSHFIPAPQS